MKLDQARIILRPRSLSELLDLALRFMAGVAAKRFFHLGLIVLLPAWALCVAARWVYQWDWLAVWALALTLATPLQGVFTIAVGLVDLRGLRAIRRESPGEFRLAVLTAAVVVAIGVEQGIVLAMVLSLLRHVRHSYRPHTAVLVRDGDGQWRPTAAVAGATSAPGLVVLRFGADLFYANAGHFAETARALVDGAPTPVRWLVVVVVTIAAGMMLRSAAKGQ